MKNNLFILGAFLCTALFVTSCTDDNKDDDENEGKASIIVGINMQPQADMGYIVPIQDMKAGTMSFANAVETKITPYLMSYRDWVFYVPGTSEGTIVKYSRQDDGTTFGSGDGCSHVCFYCFRFGHESLCIGSER